MNRLLAYLLLALAPFTVLAQDSRRPITNADVISMTKSGLGEQTIILAIQQGPTAFDTSPQALIELKKAGVTDGVLNLMLSGSNSPSIAPATMPPSPDPSQLLDRALNAIGPAEKLTSIQSTRYIASRTQSGSTGTVVSEVERVAYYPDRLYLSINWNGQTNKVVVTPTFNYRASGKMTATVPPADLEDLRSGMQFDSAYIAQHKSAFVPSYDGSENIGGEIFEKLRIRNGDGKEAVWTLDHSGRIHRIVSKGNSGEAVAELSDYRLVDGINVPFKRHVIENGRTSDLVLSQFEINPSISPTLFTPPSEQPVAGLRIRVLQEQSVPYVQQIGGGISTSCNISGSANTSMTATTTGNVTFGNATTTSGLQMHCNSYDTTVRWPHVLNAMLVEASDGNAYIIACDRAWRWSKCVPLRAGDTFNARHTSKGMAVQAFNTKGQESEPTYTVLQSKAVR